MIKRIVSTVLIAAVFAMGLAIVGCGDEIQTHQQKEIHDQPIHQETVVE